MKKISSSILSDDKTQVIVKSDDVTKDNIDYEFVLNTFNYDEIVAFEKFYDMAKKQIFLTIYLLILIFLLVLMILLLLDAQKIIWNKL